MTNEILQRLTQIEKDHNVRILYACESGSRAWGFPSTDSDFDVRFIYVHPKSWYLSIDEQRDTIDIPVNEILDINGWELRKALRLFRKSNAPLYEWLQSPIIYRKQDAFTGAIRSLMPQYFSLRAGCHHYLSMAYNSFTELQGTEVRMKKYFYCLRPLLAALWIVDKQELPPMEFQILRTLITDPAWYREIDGLLALKAIANEKSTIPPIPLLQAFIKETMDHCEARSKDIEKKEVESETLNNLFRTELHDF